MFRAPTIIPFLIANSEKTEVSYVEAKYLKCAFNGGHRRSSGDSQLEGR